MVFTPKAYDKIWTFCPWTRLHGLAEYEAVPVMFPTKSSENTAHAKIYSIPVVLMDIVLILKPFSSVRVTKPTVLPTYVGYWNQEMWINVLMHTSMMLIHLNMGLFLWSCDLNHVPDFKLSNEQLKKQRSSKLFIGQSRPNNCCP